MKVKFESRFTKDLSKIKEPKLLAKVKTVIVGVKKASRLEEVNNLLKLQGYEAYYRIRVGDYRIGIELIEDVIIFTRVLHRKDIYRYFQ